MSEENVPKLRLKPKLAAVPIDAPKPPGATPPTAEPAADVGKSVRLKPKLSALPPSEGSPGVPPPTIPESVGPGSDRPEFPPPAGSPAPESDPEAGKSGAKFSLRPKATGEAPPAFPPPPASFEKPVLPSPIPAPEYVDPEQANEPAMAVPRSITSRPFPPPPANFPPPPAGGGRPAPPWASTGGGGVAPKKKNFVLLGGGVVVVLLVLGGGFLAFKKFTADSPRPPKPAITATPPVETPVVPAPAETKPVAETPAPITAQVPETPVPEPVEAAPPPSAAFKAWVDALRIGGVRAGINTRVFIGGTAYATGETVNSQLGIVFDSYNADTRRLVFKDKTGATVERRN